MLQKLPDDKMNNCRYFNFAENFNKKYTQVINAKSEGQVEPRINMVEWEEI